MDMSPNLICLQSKAADDSRSSVEDDESSNFGLGEKVIKEMTDDLLNKNHEVYFH